MDEDQKRKFKSAAQAEIEELKAEIPRLKELVKPVAPDNAIGRVSRMDNIVNQSVAEAQLSKAKVRLVRLKEALKRVDEDEEFGICLDCGDPIPMARLLAMPRRKCAWSALNRRILHVSANPISLFGKLNLTLQVKSSKLLGGGQL